MIISAEPETSDSYVARVVALVHDPGTRIYFDTSFLIWLAKLGRAARAEFFAWVSTIGDKRFHVPVWSAHEYFKHHMAGTVERQFRDEMSSFDSAARRFYRFTRSFCSPELFGSLVTGEQFVNEFQTSVQRIRAMLELARNGSRTEIDNGLKDVAKFIDAHLIDTPLFEIIDGIDNEERVRNRGRVPPSFQDAHKQGTRRPVEALRDVEEAQLPIGQDNSFGDLVIWKEILAHAKKVKTSAVILATNDRKNDWYVTFKGDQSVSPDLRRLSPHIPAVPTPHPLLQREAQSCVPVGGLTLIDSPYMGAVLNEEGGHKEFAAVAFDIELPSITKDLRTNVKSWASRLGSVGSLPSISEPSEASVVATNIAGVSQHFDCDDFKVAIVDCTEIARPILERITQLDLATRATVLSEILWDGLTAWSQRDLVVLGRELFRLADDGDPVGAQFLRDFRDQALLLDPKLSQPLFVGMLMALYFDQSSERRQPSGLDTAHAILDLVVEPALFRPAAAVGELAEAADPKPLFLPGSELAEIALQVIVEPSADGKSPADLITVQLDGHDLITETQPEPELAFATFFKGARDVQLGTVLDIISRYHLLPRRLLKPNQNPDSRVRLGEVAGIELDI